MSGTMEWTRVASPADVPPGSVIQVMVNGEPIALYNLDGSLHATADVCTHAFAYLSEGYLDGDTIECPLHQGVFHIPTGRAMGPPLTCNLAVFAVRTEGDDILIGGRIGS